MDFSFITSSPFVDPGGTQTFKSIKGVCTCAIIVTKVKGIITHYLLQDTRTQRGNKYTNPSPYLDNIPNIMRFSQRFHRMSAVREAAGKTEYCVSDNINSEGQVFVIHPT